MERIKNSADASKTNAFSHTDRGAHPPVETG
jgi:hypothetical protein